MEHKLIRKYEVTPASSHDSEVFEELLDEANTSRDVWGDSAYGSRKRECCCMAAFVNTFSEKAAGIRN